MRNLLCNASKLAFLLKHKNLLHDHAIYILSIRMEKGGMFSFIVDDRVPLHITRQNSDRFYPKLAILYIHRYHTKINIKHSQDTTTPWYSTSNLFIYYLSIRTSLMNIQSGFCTCHYLFKLHVFSVYHVMNETFINRDPWL